MTNQIRRGFRPNEKHVRIVLSLVIAVLLLLLGCKNATPPDDDDSNNYDPRNITRIDDHIEAQPDIAIDSRGNIHLVYFGASEYNDPTNVYYIHNTMNETWIEPVMLSDSTEHDSKNPQIIIDSQDNVHVIWEGGDELRTFYTRKITADSWSEPKPITTTFNPLPQLAIDPQDNLHMVGMGINRGTYRQRQGEQWIPEETLPNTLTNPSLVVSLDGTAHVVFETGSQLIGYLRRTPDGTWQDWEQVSPADSTYPYNGYPWVADVAVYRDTVYVCWTKRYTQQILLRRRFPDGSWSEVESVPAVQSYTSGTGPYEGKLAANQQGLFLAWEEKREPDGEHEIYYTKRFHDGAWLSANSLSQTPTPSLGLGIYLKDKTLHLVWQELLEYSKYGNVDIYYTSINTGE